MVVLFLLHLFVNNRFCSISLKALNNSLLYHYVWVALATGLWNDKSNDKNKINIVFSPSLQGKNNRLLAWNQSWFQKLTTKALSCSLHYLSKSYPVSKHGTFGLHVCETIFKTTTFKTKLLLVWLVNHLDWCFLSVFEDYGRCAQSVQLNCEKVERRSATQRDWS